MSYVHTKECDAFYELSQAGHLALPPSIRAQINPRHRAKVRITTDQKTGKELAKIVKARVADLDIYSPRTAFDWRVSVNLEMNYDGDMRDLVETTEGGKRADRNKDRMSYTHLAYQIDLTQVTPFEVRMHQSKNRPSLVFLALDKALTDVAIVIVDLQSRQGTRTRDRSFLGRSPETGPPSESPAGLAV